MKHTILARALLGLYRSSVLLALGQSSVAFAASIQPANVDTLTVANEVTVAQIRTQPTELSNFSQWLPALLQEVSQLPEVQAQLLRQQQAEMAIKAADQAVYNPELGLNYQNADTDTYSLDISQTLDWGDKRSAATRLATLEARILLSDIGLERSQMLAERLLVLAEQAQMRKALTFAEQQVRFTQAQLNIAQQRLAAGDLSNVELQLMQLELASNTADFALAEQAALMADSKVIELLGTDKLMFGEFIGDIRRAVEEQSPSASIPALQSRYQQVLLAKARAEQVKADTSADPTMSLSAEKEGTDNKFGIGVSIPLQLRNNYQQLQSVAEQEITIAQQQYLASERVLTAKQAQFSKTLPRLLERYQDWREQVQASGAQVAKSLSQQWQAGDVSTSEYLQSRRQLASSYLVGLALETAIYQSWLTWMGESGLLVDFFAPLQVNLQSSAQGNKQMHGEGSESFQQIDYQRFLFQGFSRQSDIAAVQTYTLSAARPSAVASVDVSLLKPMAMQHSQTNTARTYSLKSEVYHATI